MTLRLDAEETQQARPAAAPGLELDAPSQARGRAVHGAGRGRHDPARAAALRRHRACRCSPINFGEIGFLATVEPDDDRRRHPPRAARRLRAAAPAGDRRRVRHRRADGDQRRRDPPQGRRARRRARLRARRRGGRQRPLRRARRRHAGRLDRLQPRQRRTGDGVGGGGLRRVVHRAALDHRACAGRRPRRPPARSTTARASRSTSPSTAARRARSPPGRRSTRASSNDRGTLAQLPGSSFYRRLREKFGRLAS